MNDSLKPGVSRQVHLFAAPFLWTAVGAILIARGWNWLGPGVGKLWLLAALVLGTLKSTLVLDMVVRRSVERITRFGDNTCLGAVYSWKSWLLAALMAGSGIYLRHLVRPGPVIGTLYCAIGWALCYSSRLGWFRWYRLVHHHELT